MAPEPLKLVSVPGRMLVSVPGRMLVCTAGNDDTVRLWDAGNGEPLLVLKGPAGTIRSLAVTVIGGAPAIVAAGVSGAVCWWNLSVARPELRLLSGHTGSIAATGIGSTAGRPLVVTGGQDETVRIWDPLISRGTRPDRSSVSESGHEADLTALAVAAVAGVVSSGDEDGALHLWDLAQGESVTAFTADQLGARPAEAYGAAGLAIHSLATGTVDGTTVLVIGRADGSLTFLDISTRRVLLQVDAHVGPISALVTVLVDGRPVVFSAGDDAVIQKRDLRNGELLAELAGHTNFVNALQVTAEGALVSGSTDGSIRIWSAVDAVQLGPALHSDEDTVNCVTVVERARPGYAGPTVVGSGDDGRLQFWDVPTGELVDSIRVSDQSVDAVTTVMTPDGPVVVTGGEDGILRTWDPISGALLAARA